MSGNTKQKIKPNYLGKTVCWKLCEYAYLCMQNIGRKKKEELNKTVTSVPVSIQDKKFYHVSINVSIRIENSIKISI